MKFRNLGAFVAACFMLPSVFAQQYSQGPRYTGEEVLEELLLGRKSLVIKVGSGGCTSKGSYRIDTRQVAGISPQIPHYLLTIHRAVIDECKAIVDDGPVIYWDLEKDLGLKGKYTVSVQNRIGSTLPPFAADDAANSMLSAVKKTVEMEGRESKEDASKGKSDRRKP